jgi:hypothetical protein
MSKNPCASAAASSVGSMLHDPSLGLAFLSNRIPAAKKQA